MQGGEGGGATLARIVQIPAEMEPMDLTLRRTAPTREEAILREKQFVVQVSRKNARRHIAACLKAHFNTIRWCSPLSLYRTDSQS